MSERKTLLSFDVGVKNLAFCTAEEHTDSEKSTVRILDWRNVNIGEERKTKKSIPIRQNVEELMKTLQGIFENYAFSLNLVLIEQQPGGTSFVRNSRMKIISHCIQSYFVLKGVKVEFVSPKKKQLLFPVEKEKESPSSKKRKRKKN